MVITGLRIRYGEYNFEKMKKCAVYDSSRSPIVKVHGFGKALSVGKYVDMTMNDNETVSVKVDITGRESSANTLAELAESADNTYVDLKGGTLTMKRTISATGKAMYNFVINTNKKGC